MNEQRQTPSSGFKTHGGGCATQHDRPQKSLSSWVQQKDGVDTCPDVLTHNKYAPSQSHNSAIRGGLSRVTEGRIWQ